ncbi:MAG: DUF4349 domain-containing protein [Lachnospiraceae bacterium]|nr:DUF4349 domain-containing protein [Lachnospiraceae bacterium]
MKKNILWKQITPSIRRAALSAFLAMGLVLTGCGQTSDTDTEEDVGHTSYAMDKGIATYANETAEAAVEGGADEEVPGGYMAMGDEAKSGGAAASPEDISADIKEGDAAAQAARKLIRNMSLSLETTAFDDFIANVESQVDSMGGYIEDSSISGGSGQQSLRYGYMTVRIPADQLDAFADTISGSATVLNRSTSVSDVTLQYSDLESHIEALKIEQQTLMDMLSKAKEIETVLAIQNQLTSVRYELESYGSQLKLMENQVSYSTVNIDINEVEIPTPIESDTFGSRVSRTFRNSMSGFAHGLENFLVWFLGNIVFIAAFFVIVILVFLGLRKIFRRRKEKKGTAALGKTAKDAGTTTFSDEP